MKIPILLILIAMPTVGCDKENNEDLAETYSRKLNIKYSFQMIDRVVVNYTDSFFIARPRSVAVFKNGRLSFGDGLDRAVKIASSTGKWEKRISRKGSGPGETQSLAWHCIDETGRVWISDYGLRRVSVYDTNGSVLDTWSPIESCEDCTFLTGMIRVVGKRLYIGITRGSYLPVKVDNISSLVTAFDLKHKRIAEYGGYQQIIEDYSVVLAHYVFNVDSSGNLYFVHDHSYDIWKYSPDGKILKRFNYPVKAYRPIATPRPTRGGPKKIEEWYTTMTTTGNLEIVGKYLFISFVNKDQEYAENPDLRYRHEYLQVFDLDGNCFVDYLEVPGQFLCKDDANVLYFLEEDEPDRLVISKYTFVVEEE